MKDKILEIIGWGAATIICFIPAVILTLYVLAYMIFLFLLPKYSYVLENFNNKYLTSEKVGFENYYINAELNPDGSLDVEEYIDSNGKYNGIYKDIYYQNPYSINYSWNDNYVYDGKGNSYLNNGRDLHIIEVASIDIDDNFNFNNLNKYPFKEVEQSDDNSYGDYNLMSSNGGKHLKIYLPSKKNKALYLHYTIDDIALINEDCGELYWNLINRQEEYINHLRLELSIPNNQQELLIWGHGPLNGTITKEGNNKLIAEVYDIEPNQDIDIRTLFDSEVLSLSTKRSNVSIKEQIITLENEKADKSDKEKINKAIELIDKARSISKYPFYLDAYNYTQKLPESEEKDRLLNDLKKIKLQIKENEIQKASRLLKYTIVSYIIFIILLIIEYVIYKPKNTQEVKYLREKPYNTPPTLVSYLYNHKIKKNAVTAEVIKLISDKALLVSQKENEIYFTKNSQVTNTLNKKRQSLIKIICGSNNFISLTDFKKRIKNKKVIKDELNTFYYEALKETNGKKYYKEDKALNKIIKVLFIIMLVINTILFFVNINTDYITYMSTYISIISVLVSIILVYYSFNHHYLTDEGQEKYNKWEAYKRFLQNFGRLYEKEVKETPLWNDHLVYACLFNCNKEVAKTLKTNISNIEESTNISNTTILSSNIIALNVCHSINSYKPKSSSTTRAYTTHHSSSSSSSSSSSYSSSSHGSGGGFSSGGGHGGGGSHMGHF